MKKFFTLVVLLATISVAAQAQLKFGVKGGLNLTSMKFDKDAVDPSNQAGFFIGPTIKFTLPVVGLGIDASALYDQRSAKIGDETLKQQSIQIPVNLRYGIGLGSTASIYLFAGPQFGFAVGDKVTEIVGNAVDWRLKDSNLSANVGLGLMLLDHLQVSANYNIALGTTGEVDAGSAINSAWNTVIGKAKANSWQLSVAYFF
ncbi:MAG: porin family protein [Prevotella sp.]|nr:porin family protein [Prevotella sp.]MBR1557666.1 porin family protein [Prevotella sp.]